MFEIGDIIYCKTDNYEFGVVENFTKKGRIRVRLLKPTKIKNDWGNKTKIEFHGETSPSSIKHIHSDGFYVNKKKQRIQYHRFTPNSDLPTCPFLTVSDIVIKYRYPIMYFLSSILFLIITCTLFL